MHAGGTCRMIILALWGFSLMGIEYAANATPLVMEYSVLDGPSTFGD